MAIKTTIFFLLLIVLPLATEAKDPVNLGGKEAEKRKTQNNKHVYRYEELGIILLSVIIRLFSLLVYSGKVIRLVNKIEVADAN